MDSSPRAYFKPIHLDKLLLDIEKQALAIEPRIDPQMGRVICQSQIKNGRVQTIQYR